MTTLIAHRGNLKGPNPPKENKPSYIISALNKGYDVEIDVWYYDEKWWLGHDEPQYKISLEWIENRKSNLWVHCKNLGALELFVEKDTRIGVSSPNYFWHQDDDYTLTSHGFIWTFPDKKLSISRKTICVLPELGYSGNFNKCYGICTDFISNYTLL
jgi:hypothetical protein